MDNFVADNYDFCTVVKVNTSRATIQEAEEIKSFLAHLVQNGNKNLIVDFSETKFMDSTFLGAIVLSLKRAVGAGGDLRLIKCECEDSVVWTMFHATRMDKVFQVFESIDDAVNSFRA